MLPCTVSCLSQVFVLSGGKEAWSSSPAKSMRWGRKGAFRSSVYVTWTLKTVATTPVTQETSSLQLLWQWKVASLQHCCVCPWLVHFLSSGMMSCCHWSWHNADNEYVSGSVFAYFVFFTLQWKKSSLFLVLRPQTSLLGNGQPSPASCLVGHPARCIGGWMEPCWRTAP